MSELPSFWTKKMLLPDVNVWLALTFEAHVHHPAARAWFDGLSNEICFFCRLTQQGFLRLASNSRAFGSDAISLPDAWRACDQFLGDQRVAFANEPAGLEAFWRAFTNNEAFSKNIWSDAYLVAFAAAANIEVVTFDRGFARYKTARCNILS